MRSEFFSPPTATRVAVSMRPVAIALRVGRARLDVSQDELALLAPISKFRLHQAERGLIALRKEELARLAAVLEIPELLQLAETAHAG